MSEVAVTEWIDPRVRRTRQMLLDGLERLLEAKSIEEISIADIAEATTLNRATFYDHYSDKYALLEGLVEARFQDLLCRRKVVFDGSCPGALRGITLATCDYLAGMPRVACPARRQMEKHLEAAMMAVVRGMLLDGLRRNTVPGGIGPEMVAATLSGAIYGAAREWVQTVDRVAVEEAVETIVGLVGPLMMRDESEAVRG